MLSPTDNPALQSMSLVAADLFQRLGFNVRVDSMDIGTQSQRRASQAAPDKGGWNAFTTTSEGLTMADPATTVGLRGKHRGHRIVDDVVVGPVAVEPTSVLGPHLSQAASPSV